MNGHKKVKKWSYRKPGKDSHETDTSISRELIVMMRENVIIGMKRSDRNNRINPIIQQIEGIL